MTDGLGGLLGGLLLLTFTCVVCGKIIDHEGKCDTCKKEAKEASSTANDSIFDTDYKVFPDDSW